MKAEILGYVAIAIASVFLAVSLYKLVSPTVETAASATSALLAGTK